MKSADFRTGVIGPNAVAGFFSSRAVRPVKWTSPAKARVTVPGWVAAWVDLAGPGDRAAVRAAAGTACRAGALLVQAAANMARAPAMTVSDRQVTTGTAYGCGLRRRAVTRGSSS